MWIQCQYKKCLMLCLLSLSPWANAVDFGKMKPSEVGYYVSDLNTGEVLASHRSDSTMNPASTMKLLTTYASLRELGEDYKWTTEFKSDGKVEQGVLQGDLYWVGNGDPLLDQKDVVDMIDQMKRKGIHGINGKLVLDKSVWTTTGSADNFDGDAEAAFTTPPDPQMLAFKVAWLNVDSSLTGQPEVKLDPPMPDVTLNSNITTRPKGGCGDIRNYLAIDVSGKQINVKGSLPKSCIGKKAFVNVLGMDDFAYQSFLAHWLVAENSPAPITVQKGKTPKNAKLLATHQSPTLPTVLKSVNKFSNNTIARTVFLTIGQKEKGFGNTISDAERAMRRTFAQAKLYDDENLVIENGSGLSRRERVTPRFMGSLLQSVYQSKHKEAFVSSLPIAGVDGTLRGRFKNLGSSLKMKTGTLKNVRALAGYWLPDNGRKLAVVVIINSPTSETYLPDMDRLVTELVQTYR